MNTDAASVPSALPVAELRFQGAVFGTAGGGSPYLKWRRGWDRASSQTVYMDTGRVYLGDTKAGLAYTCTGDNPERTVLTVPEPMFASPGRGCVPLLHYPEWSLLVDLPGRTVQRVKRVEDNTKDSFELNDGFWYVVLDTKRIEVDAAPAAPVPSMR